MAAVLISYERPVGYGECLAARAPPAPCPEPDPPVMSTVTTLWLQLADGAKHVPHGRRRPSIPGRQSGALRSPLRAGFLRPRRINPPLLGKSNGGQVFNAPRWKAETALSRSEYAVMMMTGKPGCISRTFSSSCRPEPPGMRMSLTSTWALSGWVTAATSARASSTFAVG